LSALRGAGEFDVRAGRWPITTLPPKETFAGCYLVQVAIELDHAAAGEGAGTGDIAEEDGSAAGDGADFGAVVDDVVVERDGAGAAAMILPLPVLLTSP